MIRNLLLVSVLLVPSLLTARPVTVDDLMAVRTVVDVRISPDGERVAYVLSEPSLEKNEHAASLYIVPYAGGSSRRLTHSTRLFNLSGQHLGTGTGRDLYVQCSGYRHT
jgi:hypothetical protein